MEIELGNGYTLQDWGTAWGDGDQDRMITLADDYDIWANLGDIFPHPYTRADAEAWVALQSGRDPVEHFAVCDAAGPIGGMGLTTRQGDLLMTLSWLRPLSASRHTRTASLLFFLLGQFTGTLPRRVAPWSSIRPRVDHVYPAPLEVAHVPRHN